MSDKSLLSLREIAQELNLNYRMMLNYKNQLHTLLPAKYDGQFNKYPSECIDLFRLVSAFREEGYTFEMVRAILSGQEKPPDDGEIGEWVRTWIDQINPDQSRSIQTDLEQSRPERIDPDQSGPGHINPEQSKSIQSNIDQSRLEQINQELDDKLYDLIPQINFALTEFYKTTKALAESLENLEKELGVERRQELEIPDLEEIQIGILTEAQESHTHADLDFVKNSVQNGKPDRNAIDQWVAAARKKDPSVSYARLAEILDEAGVPTLSGREGWNRASLRNLVAKNSG